MNRQRLFSGFLAIGILFSLCLTPGWGPVSAQDQPFSLPAEQAVGTILPETVFQVNGLTQHVAWQDGIAYLGVGKSLVSLDISDPTAPARLGQSAPIGELASQQGNLAGLAVAGDYAYLITYIYDGDDGLYILDISKPAAPLEIGSTLISGIPKAIAVAGDYAYIANMVGMDIIDISDSTQPAWVGFIASHNAQGVAVAGSHAYLADGDAGLRVVDVSDPAAPAQTGVLDTPGFAMDIALAGDTAYLADSSGGLRIIDISDPTSPSETGSLTIEGAQSVAVAGDYAYIAQFQYEPPVDGGLRIIDITNPAAPAEVGNYDSPGDAYDVAAMGSLAFLADGASGLRIVDAANPAMPNEVGVYTPPYIERGYLVTVAGGFGYVADLNRGLHILDLSPPDFPVSLGRYDQIVMAAAVIAAGDYVYVSDDSLNLLKIINVSDPAIPSLAGTYETAGYPQDLQIAGNLAYLANGPDGLLVLDISNSAEPARVGALDTPGGAQAVAVSGNFAYIADGADGLRVIDVTNPITPTETGFYTITNATDVAVGGHFVYVADRDWDPQMEGGLHVIDVSNPAAPVEVGFYLAEASSVALAGQYAYLDNGFGRISIIEISDPSAPQAAGEYIVPGGASAGIWVDGNYIYIASYLHGLLILRQLTDQVTGLVPPSGGSLGSSDGSTSLIFPSGAFSETVRLIYKQLLYDESPGALAGMGHTFDLTGVVSDTGRTAALAPGQTFTITVGYTDSLKGPAIEETLALYAWDGSAWVVEPTSSVDTASNLITATPGHLSLWSVLGETRRVYLPVINH